MQANGLILLLAIVSPCLSSKILSPWLEVGEPDAYLVERFAPEMEFGQISGIFAVNESHVWVFHRAGRMWQMGDFDGDNIFTRQGDGPIKNSTIALMIDGQVTRVGGAGVFFMPHSITVDKDGNVWCTDVALHQVMKFSPTDLNSPVLVLGERFMPGNDDKHFCKPTDVKVATSGEFFISDGYCNSRVLKFNANATLAMVLGNHYGFEVPHELALDEFEDTLFVADRENAKIWALKACLHRAEWHDECGRVRAKEFFTSPIYGIDIDVTSGDLLALFTPKRSSGSYLQILDSQTFQVKLDSRDYVGAEDMGVGHAISYFYRGPYAGAYIASLNSGSVLSRPKPNGMIFKIKYYV